MENLLKQFTSAREKDPDQMKTAFIGVGSGMLPNRLQVIAWNKDDPVVDTGLLHMDIIN